MAESITQRLNEVFEKASLSYARKLFTSVDDLEKLSDINRIAAEKHDDLIRRYREEYESRVAAERQRLYQQSVQVRLGHPAPAGVPTTNNDAVTLEAHQRVRLSHEADLQRAADNAQRQIQGLLESAHQRNQTQGLATEAFLRAADRRSGHDRRTVKHSRD